MAKVSDANAHVLSEKYIFGFDVPVANVALVDKVQSFQDSNQYRLHQGKVKL
jgi:hypothetical protein